MKLILSLIIVSVMLNTAGQILFKTGMNQIGSFDFNLANALPIACKLFTNLALMSGLSIYFISTVVWFLVLSRADVSFAYPLVSIGYISNAVAAYYILHEHAFSPMRLIGTLTIMLGVIIICQS
ncbi:MAG: 4-amino-4-deoxy-L-arabinose transferase [Gammaproteobacteria bacterium]|nr:4-amino-4-deoxy-L-arabinose transferase [Gammaproteobacteria bacterium]